MFDQKKSPSYSFSSEKAEAASQFVREQDYWRQKLFGQLVKTNFPYDQADTQEISAARQMDAVSFDITGTLLESVLKLSNGSNIKIHMILTAALLVLIHKHTGNSDIIIGTPIYRQETEGEFLNTVLALRNQVEEKMTFKELLFQVKKTIIEADENQNYPIEGLLENLDIQSPDKGFPLFGIVLLLENIHNKKYIHPIYLHLDMIFSFHREGNSLEGVVEYNASLYYSSTVERVSARFKQLLQRVLADAGQPFSHIDILPEEERKQLLIEFNDTDMENRFRGTIHELFEKQVEKIPDYLALLGIHQTHEKNYNTSHMSYTSHISYKELNEKSNQLARLLRRNGVTTESVVGIMMEPTVDMVIALMAILKAGGAYLPIEPSLPLERIRYILEDSKAAALVSTSQALDNINFTSLQGLESRQGIQVTRTWPRPHIQAFDRLPRPDRSLVDLRNYKNKIGMASVTNCITVQSTRGCPYHCLYCHKIWSKHHVHRSAENLYNEIEHYYKNGVTNFAFIDDCFNLNSESSKQLFRRIIKNKLEIRIFFPNGLRGDMMPAEYIDLMVEAGTRGINLSLETASPRLQKLLKKNLDLDKFKQVMDYIASKHPDVILEMASMHGFPGETEEEALMTLEFIKNIKWLHFPYIHILKIFPNTEMEAFALEQGISKEAIMKSKNRAFHELPETLPFPKSFTRKYQADFLNNYFLEKERLMRVLPYQMQVLDETALVQKYNAYLPTEIKNLEDITAFAQLGAVRVPGGFREENQECTTIFDQSPPLRDIAPGAKRILFLDLSQHFSSHRMLYRVVEQPLGLVSLLTYLKERFGGKIDGRIYKSGNDFDSFEELKALVDEYNPHLVGIRTLTFFQEFFHETVSLLRQWGVKAPIITGGPYASSDYDTILKDKHVDLAVLGEGEHTLEQLIREMLKIDFKLPGPGVLDRVRGIAYPKKIKKKNKSREIILVDRLNSTAAQEEPGNPRPVTKEHNLAYVMYTSGSTGKPKGVMVEHRQVNNCIFWMQDKFQLKPTDMIINRTHLTFDPSVWEIFLPLYIGAGVKVLDIHQQKDPEFLIRLMAEDNRITMMYCPSTLVNMMTYLLNNKPVKPTLKLPWLIIGAEPITMEVIKNFYQYFEGNIVNTYGPTECVINNTYYDLSRDDERSFVPIGKPVANNKLYILSNDLQLMPINVAGEICIAGKSVARGYISNKKKTDQCFIDNPYGEGKLYKTGDIGKWLEDGNIEIMGRVDEQVKIRGYRIEPREIEHALLSHESIDDCLVLARDTKELQEKTRECKKCGIWSNYPGISINNEGICGICEKLEQYKQLIDQYFLTQDDLEEKIKAKNKNKKGKYDCILVYACERVATYALYQLVEMGLDVLTVTYDSGHYDRESLDRITGITKKIGVDHIFLKHRRSDDILKESLRAADTMCKGCIHTSSALAGQYAYKHGIKFVIGETLSRGQIVENKLYKFITMGVSSVEELEQEIEKLQAHTPLIDKRIFDIIDIDVVSNGSIYHQVEFIDFYRYFEVTNEEMIKFLAQKDPYWQELETNAIYSTDCKICQVGNFNHLKEKGYHYTGSAKSWDQRLGVTTLKDLKEDLKIDLTAQEQANFLEKLGYRQEGSIENGDKHLCAYFVSGKKLSVSHLREYLSMEIPAYMIPTYFIQLEEFPLTPNGKIDRKALPGPEGFRPKLKETYVAPKTDMEKIVAETWQEVLGVDRAGIEDNFFDLGGSSLDIVIVGSKLKDGIGREIPVVTLFTYPTIGGLAAHLSEEGTGEPLPGKNINNSDNSLGLVQERKSRLKQSLKKRKQEINVI